MGSKNIFTRKMKIISGTIAVAALIIFSIVTLGLSQKTAADIAREAARAQGFESASKLVIFPEGYVKDQRTSNFVDRLKQYSEGKLVCSFSDQQFSVLLDRTNLKKQQLQEGQRSIYYVELSKNTPPDDIDNSIESDSQYDVKCISISTGKLFFLQGTPHISFMKSFQV